MSFFRPDISSLGNYYDKGRFLLVWRISISFTIVFFLLAVLYGVSSSEAFLPIFIALIITSFSSIYLRLTKNFKPLFWIYSISGTFLAHFALNYVMEFTHYVDFVWVIVSILLAFLGLGRKLGIFFILLNIIGVAFFFWGTLNEHIQILQPKTNLELTADYIEMLFAFFVVAYLLQQFGKFQDYSEKELKEANENLENQNKLVLAKNAENEVLLKEIHHRVKNNLQVIISLLRLQRSEIDSDETQRHFNDAINRVMAMSLIHQKLYQEKELSKIDVKSYVQELVNEIIGLSTGISEVKLNVNSSIENIDLEIIVPFGLLINELVTNSIKHAFKNEEEPTINIVIKQDKEFIYLDFSDNGEWKESDNVVPSFGMELIDILTEQMKGEKEVRKENGTHYKFRLSY